MVHERASIVIRPGSKGSLKAWEGDRLPQRDVSLR